MLKTVFLFELRYQLRQPLFALFALAYFAVAVALASSDLGIAIGDAPGTTFRNAPIVVVRLMVILTLLSLLPITAFCCSAVLRDAECRADMLFFTKPIKRLDYLLGRFAGAMTLSLLILLVAMAGLYVSNFVPWQPENRLGASSAYPYVYGLLLVIAPNLLIMGALIFAVAVWSKRLTLTYLCMVLFIGLQDTVEVVALYLDQPLLGSLIEPSGIVALELAARFWSIAEQNSQLPVVFGALLGNRVLWLVIAAGLLALSFRRFQLTAVNQRPSKARPPEKGVRASTAKGSELDALQPAPSNAPIELAPVRLGFNSRGYGRQVLLQTRLELSEVIAGAPFLSLLAFGLIFTVAASLSIGSHAGTAAYPLTQFMLQAIQSGTRLTLVLILLFYAGELLHNSRALRLSEVYDALPVPNWVFMAAKLLSLVLIVAVYLAAATACTMAVQLAQNYTDLRPALYAQGLIFIALPLLPVIALAAFVQTVCNSKLLALLLTILALLALFALPKLGFEDNLYLYGGYPTVLYSEFNGYRGYAVPFYWHMLYWGCAALMLITATLLLWPRGRENGLRNRMLAARAGLSKPVRSVVLVGLVGMLASGLWVFENTHRRSEYLDRATTIQKLADYEQKYRQYADANLPQTTSVFAEIDIYPERRHVDVRARYRLENRSSEPIQTLPLTLSPRWVEGALPVYGGVSLKAIELPGHRRLLSDDRLGFYLIKLAQPLLPGEGIDLGFTVRVDHAAFANRTQNFLINDNGSFFSGRSVFPRLGYARDNEIQTPIERERHGLGPLPAAPHRDDAAALSRNYIEADWIKFEAIVSTAADQTAIAPGDLLREWLVGDRRYFHYQTSAPIINLLPFLSGRYEQRHERWEGVDISIYFDPRHAVNVDHFLAIAKRSLAYMSANFGPYPHQQLRIVEIPSYHGKIAFSFAQTVAFSESWGFSMNRENAEFDSLGELLAHEVAHQWWNHQMVPADTQGATLIAEALPQYAAAMILEQLYGREAVAALLKFNLDIYLRGRSKEPVGEMALARVENRGYLHYGKGTLALYALKEAIGEQALNQALAEFLKPAVFQGPPYLTTVDLITALRAHTPADRQALIDDLFEHITLFDNRIVSAGYSDLGDGSFAVELQTSTRKLRADGSGASSEIGIDDWMEIGIYAEAEAADGDESDQRRLLLIEKKHLNSADSHFSFVVGKRPSHIQIDPHHTLIDQDQNDNLRYLIEVASRQN